MRLKRNSPEYRARRLRHDVRELTLDMHAAMKECCIYLDRIKSDPGFMGGFPIRDLRDSLNYENQRPLEKGTLTDAHHMIGLRRLAREKQEALEHKKHALNIAKIEVIISHIKEVEDSLDVKVQSSSS